MYPGYKFKVVDQMFTNFHTPESTLIMLVSAFAGRENILNAYKIATEKGREIGIYTEKHEKTGGYFLVTLYNRDAQYYLLKHLDVIISLRQPK